MLIPSCDNSKLQYDTSCIIVHGMLQVPTAEGLTIRVINNVSKRMEVKPRFYDAFKQEGCPDAYPYRQKVLHTTHCNMTGCITHMQCMLCRTLQQYTLCAAVRHTARRCEMLLKPPSGCSLVAHVLTLEVAVC